jgi:hypothetical protein
MRFSKSLVDEFNALFRAGHFPFQRYGQAFYNHFSLHKSNHGAEWHEIYNADDSKARSMIAKYIDGSN